MEIARERRTDYLDEQIDEQSNEERDKSTSVRETPSAPDFDQESLRDVIEDYRPREWARPSSIWTKLRRSFSKYKPMNEDLESVNQNNSDSIPNTNPNNSNNDLVFGDLKSRNRFLRKLYAMFVGQLSWLTGLCALFYYSPHVRHIFRKMVADKIFLKSLQFGAPIGIVLVGPVFFQSFRRKCQLYSFLILTTCLSSLLCYLMTYQRDNVLLLMELALSDGCFALAGLSNLLIPRFSLRNRFEYLFFPASMLGLQGLQPVLIKQRFSSTWYMNLIFVLAASYLGYNMNSIMNDEKLALKQNEITFGLTQSFINPFQTIGNFGGRLFRNRPQSNFQPI